MAQSRFPLAVRTILASYQSGLSGATPDRARLLRMRAKALLATLTPANREERNLLDAAMRTIDRVHPEIAQHSSRRPTRPNGPDSEAVGDQ